MARGDRVRLAVLGGTGVVGRLVVAQALARGHQVVVATRGGTAPGGAIGCRVDLATGEGLLSAVTGAAAVIDASNAAVSRAREAVAAFGGMAQHVTAAAAQARVERVVLLSIVGIDAIPYGYYRGKVAQERAYLAGEVPVSVLRTTQFHEFAGQLLTQLPRWPVVVAPRMTIQPVAAADVASALLDAAEGPYEARPPELAGPDVRQLADLVRAVLAARGEPARVVSVRAPGRAGRMMARGGLLPAAGRRSPLSFEAWLAAQPRS